MEKDLAYYRRRLAEERRAADLAADPAVRAVHHDLAAGYHQRIAALEEPRCVPDMHLVGAP
jgi:hypothetical protein